MKLTPNQTEVLEALASFTRQFPNAWARPLDVGGFDGSFHGPCLFRLSERGLCERESYRWGQGRRINKYRANDETQAALAGAIPTKAPYHE